MNSPFFNRQLQGPGALKKRPVRCPGVTAGCCKSLPFAADDIEDLAKARSLKSYDELIGEARGWSAAILGPSPQSPGRRQKKASGEQTLEGNTRWDPV